MTPSRLAVANVSFQTVASFFSNDVHYANHIPHKSTDFSSSGACNRRDLMALKYYPTNSNYCSAKAMSKFRALEVWFHSLDECCHTKFPQYVSDCCESSDGGCSLSGKLRFIPVSSIIIKSSLKIRTHEIC
jgi:hypothetical protein